MLFHANSLAEAAQVLEPALPSHECRVHNLLARIYSARDETKAAEAEIQAIENCKARAGSSVRTAFLAAPLLLRGRLSAPPPRPPSSKIAPHSSGIGFVLRNAATPERHQIETMAGGVAVFDFDNDGYPDIYFANGAEQPSLEKTGPQYRNRLYRNRHDWTFEDVTAKAGVGWRGLQHRCRGR